MSKIIKLNNRIKFDSNKCNQCQKCINCCVTSALELNNNSLSINNDKCISCFECIKNCRDYHWN